MARRPTTSKQGYGAQWQRIRLVILARDGNRCTQCGSTDHIQVDHIVPMSKGGTHHPANLRALCRRCNLLRRDMPPTWKQRPPYQQRGRDMSGVYRGYPLASATLNIRRGTAGAYSRTDNRTRPEHISPAEYPEGYTPPPPSYSPTVRDGGNSNRGGGYPLTIVDNDNDNSNIDKDIAEFLVATSAPDLAHGFTDPPGISEYPISISPDMPGVYQDIDRRYR